jgi:hypothetical protein
MNEQSTSLSEDFKPLSSGNSPEVAGDFVDFAEGLIKWLREKMKQ